MKKIVLSILTSSLLVSCSTSKQIKKDQTALNGMWQLAFASESKNIEKDFPEGIPTLTFDASEQLTVNGYDGCNYIKTKALIKKGNNLTIDKNIISTMMSCEKVKNIEFQKWIANTTNYEIENNVLKLKNNNQELVFHKVTLSGQWVLDKVFSQKQSIEKLFPFKKPFINLDIFSTKFTGNTACNMLSGKVTMHQNNIKFEHISTTRMFCEGTSENIFIDALTKATHFKLEGTRLILLQKDKKLLEFKKEL